MRKLRSTIAQVNDKKELTGRTDLEVDIKIDLEAILAGIEWE